MDRRSLLALTGAAGLCGFSPRRREQCRRDGEFPDGVKWFAVWQEGSAAAPPSGDWPNGFPATPDRIFYSYRKMLVDEGWLKLSIVGSYDRFIDGRTDVNMLKVEDVKNARSTDMPEAVRANMATSSNGRPAIAVRYIFTVGAREIRSRFPIELQTDPEIGAEQIDRQQQEAAKRLAIDYWSGTPMRVRVLAGPDDVVVRDITVPTLDFAPDRLASQFRALWNESRTRVCTQY